MYDSLKIKPHFFFNQDDYTNLLKIWSGKMRVSKKKYYIGGKILTPI